MDDVNPRKNNLGHKNQTQGEKMQEKQLVSVECNTLQIINLSSYHLTDDEISVLERGLTFSPSCGLDKFLTTKDLFFFCRRLIFKILYSQRTLPAQIAEMDRQLFSD